MNFEKLLPIRDFLRVDNKYYPEFIYSDDAISDGVKSLYVYFYNKIIDGSLTINIEALAKKLNVTDKTVRNHIKVLVDNEYVEVKSNGFKKANTYSLLKNSMVKKFMKEEFFMKKSKKNLQGKNYRLNKELIKLNPPTPQSMKIQNKANQTNVVKNSLQGTFEDFNKIVDAYPNKECLKVAKKVYFSQFKQGNLPSCLALLEIIEKFKQSDSRWKNGYVPMLKNFLRFERYKEEPLVREQKSFVFEDKNTPKEEKKEENLEQLRAKFDQSRFDKPLENYLTYKTKTLSPDQAERVLELNKKWADKIGRNPEIDGYIKAIFANSNNPEGYLRFAEDTLHYSKEKIELSLSNFIKKHKNIFKPFILEDYLEDTDEIEEEEKEGFKIAVSY